MGNWIRYVIVKCIYIVLLFVVADSYANNNSDTAQEQAKAVVESLKNLEAAREHAREKELRLLPELIASGERGNVIAQLKLSQFYSRGQMKDSIEAMKWLTMAAEQDNPMALWLMGSQYKMGEHVLQSNSRAIHWYKKSVKQKKDPSVMYSLASVYEDEQDYVMAIYWHERSANLGFKPSQLRLGEIYYRGLGVEADLEVACQWIRKAVENRASNWHLEKTGCVK